jgi:hypothetical protein
VKLFRKNNPNILLTKALELQVLKSELSNTLCIQLDHTNRLVKNKTQLSFKIISLLRGGKKLPRIKFHIPQQRCIDLRELATVHSGVKILIWDSLLGQSRVGIVTIDQALDSNRFERFIIISKIIIIQTIILKN